MIKASRTFALFVFALSMLAQASIALAAPAEWKSVNVTLQSQQQQSMLLVSGELPESAKLPVQAELAVPAGTQLQWIGEILGGDPAKDPELTYTKSSAGGMDIYRFTLTRARRAQVEGAPPSAVTLNGTDYLTSLKWTAWQDLPEVQISHRIPQGARIVQPAPGAALQPADSGYNYYTKTVTAPKAGDVIELSFSYNLSAVGSPARTGAGATGQGSVVLPIIVIAALGGFALLIFKVNRKVSAQRAEAEPEYTQAAEETDDLDAVHNEPAKRVPSGARDEASASKKIKPAFIVLAIVGALVLGFVVAGAKGTSATVADGKISRNFGAPSACQASSIPFTANEGVDLARQGGELLKGFEGMDGIGVVTIDLEQSRIDVGWCESSQSEDSIRQVLSAPGLITLGQGTSSVASAPTTATLDPSGKKQTVAVDTSTGSFTPSEIVLKAGVPAELSFGQAVGCLSKVVISDLGIDQDLTKGPATVSVPALKAGSYSFVCGMGHQSGQLIVQ